MLSRFSEAAGLLESNNVGCGLLDDAEAIKLQLPNNRRLSRAGGSCQDESFHAFLLHWRLGRCLALCPTPLHAQVPSLTVDAGAVLQLQTAYDLRISTPDDDHRLARLCRGA